MKVVRAVPTESISEKLSVQRLGEALGVRNLRVNVFTLAEGSMSKHLHREQEEVYLVLDGRAMIDSTRSSSRWGERDALAVPARAWHRVANVGRGPLTFFVVAAPAVDDAEIAGWPGRCSPLKTSGSPSSRKKRTSGQPVRRRSRRYSGRSLHRPSFRPLRFRQ